MSDKFERLHVILTTGNRKGEVFTTKVERRPAILQALRQRHAIESCVEGDIIIRRNSSDTVSVVGVRRKKEPASHVSYVEGKGVENAGGISVYVSR